MNVASVTLLVASRILDYSREVNNFSINLRIANISRNNRKDVTCWEHGKERRCDDARERAVPAGKIADIYATDSRFGPCSNQQRIFFATHIRTEILRPLAILWKLVTLTSHSKKEVHPSAFASCRTKAHERKLLFYKAGFQNFRFIWYLLIWHLI